MVNELGASGEVINPAKDYLLVVDANLGAFKSDSVMIKDIDYRLDFQGAKAKSYLQSPTSTRVALIGEQPVIAVTHASTPPLGSTLNSIKAQGALNLEAESINSYDDLNLQKTVFGFFFSLEPGTAGST